MKKIIVADDEEPFYGCSDFSEMRLGAVTGCGRHRALELYADNPIRRCLFSIYDARVDGWGFAAIREKSMFDYYAHRAQSGISILIVCSRAGRNVTKPCSPSVLMRFRRCFAETAALRQQGAFNRRFRVDNFAHEVWLSGKSVTLTLKEIQHSAKAFSSPGRVFFRAKKMSTILWALMWAI